VNLLTAVDYVDTAALEQTLRTLADKKKELETEVLPRQEAVLADLRKARTLQTDIQEELAGIQTEQRAMASRANELASKRETLDRLVVAGRANLDAELRRVREEIVIAVRRSAETEVRRTEMIRGLCERELERGLAQLQVILVESENVEKREKMEQLKRLIHPQGLRIRSDPEICHRIRILLWQCKVV